MTTGKTIALTRQTFVDKVMSLLFNMLSRLVIAFLPRRKCLLISWLQSPSALILEPKKIKSVTVSPSIFYEVMGPDAMILVFWMLSFKPTFSLSSFTFIKRLFSSSSLSAIRVVSVICISEVTDISPGNLDSSLCFLQLSVSHDALCIEFKWAGWQYLTYSFPYLEPVCFSMSSSNCCFLTCIQISQEAGQVVWYSHHFKNFPQFVVIHTAKGFGVVNKAKVDVFLKLSCFFNYPQWPINFPDGTSGKEHTCQCKRHKRRGFDPWVGKIP